MLDWNDLRYFLSVADHGSTLAAGRGFEEASAALGRDASGTIRITTQEIFANTLLAPMLRELHERHPEILIELDTAQELLELGEGQADIAIRSTAQEPPAGTV